VEKERERDPRTLSGYRVKWVKKERGFGSWNCIMIQCKMGEEGEG
jgi:hypothetical protein